MFVGGSVRKYLLNQKVDDIDIATTLKPEEIIKKFENSKIIVKKTANKDIKIAITPVVPHPIETLPYSEFNGFNKVPKGVTVLVVSIAFCTVVLVAINDLKLKMKQRILLSIFFTYNFF